MELRERRVAQIVRDFFEAYMLSDRIGEHLRAGDLDFTQVKRFVGEDEESALYRLKEGCHALFRQDVDAGGPRQELQAEEFFDLAVGGLFHEAMRFREGYYLTTTYGPRLDRMMEEGTASGTLAAAFRRVFEAGHRRMVDSHEETQALLRETREQLRILLRQAPPGGLLARCLVEQRSHTELVFGTELPTLLAEMFGSAAGAYELAVESLVDHGHYSHAAALLEREDVRSCRDWPGAGSFVQAMDDYYAGRAEESLEQFADWVAHGFPGVAGWTERARRVLGAIASESGGCRTRLRKRAEDLAEELSSGSRS
jgi:hypothetical protein